MRKIVLLSMVLSLFFLGCHKDGVYNPKEKIKRIYTQEQGKTKELKQEWTWEKELLTKVEYFKNNYSNGYNLFSYLDKRLMSIVTSGGAIITFNYYGREYDFIEESDMDGRIHSKIKFTYDKNKISKTEITLYDYDDMANWKSKNDIISIIEPLFPTEFKESMDKIKSNIKNGTYTTRKITSSFTYDGKNLKEMKSEGVDIDGSFCCYTYTYTKYDKNSNPKYHYIFGNDENGYAIGVTSKNNPLEVKHTYRRSWGDDNQNTQTESGTTTYEYVYNGKFPTAVKTAVRNGNGTNYQYTTFYEYE